MASLWRIAGRLDAASRRVRYEAKPVGLLLLWPVSRSEKVLARGTLASLLGVHATQRQSQGAWRHGHWRIWSLHPPCLEGLLHVQHVFETVHLQTDGNERSMGELSTFAISELSLVEVIRCHQGHFAGYKKVWERSLPCGVTHASSLLMRSRQQLVSVVVVRSGPR